MPKNQRFVKIVRKGRIIEVPRWVAEYNRRKRAERKVQSKSREK